MILHTRIIRALGSDITHVAVVHIDQFDSFTFIGADFIGVQTPLITQCGANLRSGVTVCMKSGSKVKCSRCRRITGILLANENNELIPQHIDSSTS
jgi:hypothetical protein